MRKSKKIFACFLIGIGILVLPFSLIKGFPAAFIVSAGSALIAKIMDEDERNVLINGKAYTLVSEFTNTGFIVLALYSAICKADMAGCMIAIGIFLLSQVVYVVCFKYFDRH